MLPSPRLGLVLCMRCRPCSLVYNSDRVMGYNRDSYSILIFFKDLHVKTSKIMENMKMTSLAPMKAYTVHIPQLCSLKSNMLAVFECRVTVLLS